MAEYKKDMENVLVIGREDEEYERGRKRTPPLEWEQSNPKRSRLFAPLRTTPPELLIVTGHRSSGKCSRQMYDDNDAETSADEDQEEPTQKRRRKHWKRPGDEVLASDFPWPGHRTRRQQGLAGYLALLEEQQQEAPQDRANVHFYEEASRMLCALHQARQERLAGASSMLASPPPPPPPPPNAECEEEEEMDWEATV